MTTERNLYTIITEKQGNITQDEAESLYELISYKCHQYTKSRLHFLIVESKCIYLPPFGIYRRMIFENGKARYYAGQDYPGEITYIKELMLGKH